MIDRDRVRQLLALLRESGSLELSVREGSRHIRIRRSGAPSMAAPAVEPPAQQEQGWDAEVARASAVDVVVSSKLVGRFYTGKGPGQPPIVRIGDYVESGQTVATIEALGKMTTVTAPEAGRVIEILCEDGQPVGYGTPLLRLQRVVEPV